MTHDISAAARDLLRRLCDDGMQSLRDCDRAPAAELEGRKLAKVAVTRAVATCDGRMEWERIQKRSAAR